MNDVIYNEIVATPGYELVFAAGTTYSLDITTFMALTLAFSRLGEISDADFNNPMRLLEGIGNANKKIALFCNRGGIIPPKTKSPLSAILDNSVFEVEDNRADCELANFHPKIWVIKEQKIEDKMQQQIKLIVLSRNLTNDSSLDVAVSLTAPLGDEKKVDDKELRCKHAPLKEFLMRLADFAEEKRDKVIALANDIDRLGPFEICVPYTDYDFEPVLFGENLNRNIDLKQELPARKMIVVSPFIDLETLKWLKSATPQEEKTLITRLDSLTPEIMNLYRRWCDEVWTMSPYAEQNEVQPMNLHAKIYNTWDNVAVKGYLWLGSANATVNGFHRNTEFLLRLSYNERKEFYRFKNEFCDEKKNLCEKIESLPEIEPASENHSISIAVRRWLISHDNLSAEVIKVKDGYEVRISAKIFKPLNAIVSIAPLQTPENKIVLTGENRSGTVHISNLCDLSDFYLLSVEPYDDSIKSIKMVIKIPTSGIPKDDRYNTILRNIIDTTDKFRFYVEMMISDRPQEFASIFMQQLQSGGSSGYDSPTPSSNLYESFLRLAATNPDKLNDIRDLVKRLDKRVVTDSFRQTSSTFHETIKKLSPPYGNI